MKDIDKLQEDRTSGMVNETMFKLKFKNGWQIAYVFVFWPESVICVYLIQGSSLGIGRCMGVLKLTPYCA